MFELGFCVFEDISVEWKCQYSASKKTFKQKYSLKRVKTMVQIHIDRRLEFKLEAREEFTVNRPKWPGRVAHECTGVQSFAEQRLRRRIRPWRMCGLKAVARWIPFCYTLGLRDEGVVEIVKERPSSYVECLGRLRIERQRS
jgi:hypothetical protein